MLPKISVCVTTYNRDQLLDQTLQSLYAQTRQPDELIVSDNCSTDDTQKVVKKWEKKFPRFHYNRNRQNLGMPRNLNLAVGLATGEYVANLHDGDTFNPAMLEQWERALDTYPSAGFVFCGISGWPHHTEFGNGIILHDVQPFTQGRTFFEKHFLHKFSSIVWGTVMARRMAYDELLPFDPAFSMISDVDMWMRMCLKYDVAYVRKPLIIIDNSPTKWREFDWKRQELTRKMQIVNIQRFYGNQSDLLQHKLSRHKRVVQQHYMSMLLGRLWHQDWPGLREGLRVCRNLGYPLRMLGVLRHG